MSKLGYSLSFLMFSGRGMGILRLLLAGLVVASHLGIDFKGWNIGVWAVVIFYLLAGHVVAKLWRRRPSGDLGQSALWFYRDRALRIFPLYFAALGMSVVVWGLGAQSHFLEKTPGVLEWVSNVIVIPLNYYMWSGVDRFMLVPPAWSLGAEIQFYLALPLLLAWPRVGIVAGLGSLMVFVCAQSGLVNTDIYGYRLFAGVLFIFLSGVLLERKALSGAAALCVLWLLCLLYVFFLYKTEIRRVYDMEVAFGYLIGLPLIILLGKIRFGRVWFKIQRECGNMSYGLFVFHFPVIWMLELIQVSGAMMLPLVVFISLVLSVACHYGIERPVWKGFRRKIPLELPPAAIQSQFS
ncbi:acyltransferase [Pseudomonas capeferrum]|uniref:acyltransferase family protein n=1 Tax=Pseudomonas capeferrum TaxID=1495066 RepID=UPI0015E3E6AC|nr:acyltransferase [Pseudomonas capeferrum]MBA1202659.1 acyltransferase [Pseudomonas capeferrum]